MLIANTVLAIIKQGRASILLLSAMLVVSACATRIDNVHRVMLDDNIGYVLQPIPENLINTGIQALFSIKQQGNEKQFLIQVEMTQSQILISAMTVEGLSLFNLDWHTQLGILSYDKKIAIEPLRVLAELQLVLWPVIDITQGLEQAKIKIVTDNYREINSEDDLIYQIKQQGSISYMTNVQQNYLLVIEELERWQLLEENSVSKEVVEN
ncbi:MAG: hypothetical protein COB83_10085 [Gammaproteobacteria bacterium]|nr:MAG: hypothetical protein COB83_10085 [Gammaproteobacteria bacterium]